MASDVHQLLMRIVAQKMVFDGFSITNWDGKQSKLVGGGEILLPSTFKIGKHKPDVIGFRAHDCLVGIGEAKTQGDLESIRTARQFRDFSSVYMVENNLKCKLYLAIPSMAI